MLRFNFNFDLFNSDYFLYERFLVFLFALVPAILLVVFVLYTDRKSKEPAKNIILCLLSGFLTIALAQYLENLVMPYFSNNVVLTYIWAFLEEVSKAAIFFLFVFDNKYYDDIYDGLVYMALIALSFAGLENIMYAFSESTVASSISLALMRDFTTIPLHVICGIVIGYFLSLSYFSKTKKKKYVNIVLALLVSSFIHGTFNNLMTLLSTINVSDNDSVKMMLFVMLPLLIIMVVLFIVAIKFINKSVKLNDIFVNNLEYDDKYAYLMTSKEFLLSGKNKLKEERYNKLMGIKDKKDDNEENEIAEEANDKEEQSFMPEAIVLNRPNNKLIETDYKNYGLEEVYEEKEKLEETNDIDISSIIDETIDKDLDNMIILKTNKRKSNLESKKRRKKYRGKNRRFR
ncbi:MAG: PrsW family intramembrane metalloprotease [Tenericutes bacterium]|nr:PrsW family intramembrane metalloprotease [Mycoplasmatota bacterium]